MPPSPKSTDFAPSRFETVRVLGAGGMGVVYEALDRERDGRVALKTLRTLDADAVAPLQERVPRARRTSQHPNLVQPRRAVRGGRPAGSSRWSSSTASTSSSACGRRRPRSEHRRRVERTPTRVGDASSTVADRRRPTRRVGAASRRRFDEARLRAALGQLAARARRAARRAKVHRDIKPSNMLVTPRGPRRDPRLRPRHRAPRDDARRGRRRRHRALHGARAGRGAARRARRPTGTASA